MELYEYEGSDGKGIFKVTYQLKLIDEKSCQGLDMINVIMMDGIADDANKESKAKLPFSMTVDHVTKLSGRDPMVSGKFTQVLSKKDKQSLFARKMVRV